MLDEKLLDGVCQFRHLARVASIGGCGGTCAGVARAADLADAVAVFEGDLGFL